MAKRKRGQFWFFFNNKIFLRSQVTKSSIYSLPLDVPLLAGLGLGRSRSAIKRIHRKKKRKFEEN